MELLAATLRNHDLVSDFFFATATLNVFLAFALYFLGRVFDDDMHTRMAFGFLAIGAARALHGAFMLNVGLILFLILLLRGFGGGFIVWGALNGGRRYRETPLIFTLAVIVSSFIGAFYATNPVSRVLPIGIAVASGYAFASSVYWEKAKGKATRKTGLPAFKWISVIFGLKVAFGLVASYDFPGTLDAVCFNVIEMFFIIALLWAFIELAVQRMRISE